MQEKRFAKIFYGGSDKHFHGMALSGPEARNYRASGEIPDGNIGRIYVVPSFGDIQKMFEPRFPGNVQRVLFVPSYSRSFTTYRIRKEGETEEIYVPLPKAVEGIDREAADGSQNAVVADFGYKPLKEFLSREYGNVVEMRRYIPGSRVTLFFEPRRCRLSVLAEKGGKHDTFVYWIGRNSGVIGARSVDRNRTFRLDQDDKGIFVKGGVQKESHIYRSQSLFEIYETLLLEDEEKFSRRGSRHKMQEA